MQTVYAYSGRDVAESRRSLAVMVRNEFTDGDVEIEPSTGEVRAIIRKGLNRPIMLMQSTSYVGISFRRSWHHIRSNKAAVRLLYLIIQGELQVVNSAGSYSVRPGQISLINADEPFYSRAIASRSIAALTSGEPGVLDSGYDPLYERTNKGIMSIHMKTLALFSRSQAVIPLTTSWYLDALAEFRGKQALYTRQSPQRLKVVREHAMIESAVSSNRIEGVSMEASRIQSVLVATKPLFRDRDEEEIRGYRDALAWIHEGSSEITVNEDTLKRMHAMARGQIWDARS